MSNDIFDFLDKSTPKNKKLPSTGIIIQARMTSKRFPGKSMTLLNNKPVIQHVIERCKKVKGVDKVILAVPDTPDSEPMLQIATNQKILNFCGSETDVLDRYYQAAKFHKLEYIIRITADCPFINPVIVTEVTNLLIWRKLDYTSNIFPVRTYPKGTDVEVFTMDVLEAAAILAVTQYDREHVTPWMQKSPDLKRANVCQKIDMSEENLCVDYPDDIERLEQLIKKRKNKLI
jgi:spore coat polysaccharide biosynthesis protein SpsF (cytidylyltransferase family)